MRYLELSFLAYDTVFVPLLHVHNQISCNAGDLSTVVPYERVLDIELLVSGVVKILALSHKGIYINDL